MSEREQMAVYILTSKDISKELGLDFIVLNFNDADRVVELLKKQPEQKFFVDSDGKLTPLPVQKHGHWIVSGEPPLIIKTCSECDVRFFHNPTGKLERFCANCGAKMDEEVKTDA